MSNKNNIVASIDKINAKYSQSPIVKGVIDGLVSFIPFHLGSAITSALDTRSFQIYEKNSKQFIDEVKSLVDKLDETKIDKEFLGSDEFVFLHYRKSHYGSEVDGSVFQRWVSLRR